MQFHRHVPSVQFRMVVFLVCRIQVFYGLHSFVRINVDLGEQFNRRYVKEEKKGENSK
jgi:hypothetical protein